MKGSVCFVLPPDFGNIAGGYAVVYTYANALADRGCAVEVLHVDPTPWRTGWRRPDLLVRQLGRRFVRSRLRPVSWFSLRSSIVVRTVPSLPDRVRQADAVVATAWFTAEMVAELGLGPAHGFYLIQHYETWSGDTDQVDATWHLPLTRVVVSGWLRQIAESLDALPVTVVPNGIDATVFSCRRPPRERSPRSVTMMWHEMAWKGSAVGIAGLEQARRRLGSLEVCLFSTFAAPADLPSWITWCRGRRGASLAEIYNDAAIFLSPSLSEGYGLPIAEAMACGCAVVTTDVDGARDFAVDGTTAVVVPIDDAGAIADAIVALVLDDERRESLAAAGVALIRSDFNHEVAADRFVQTLVDAGAFAG